MILMILVCISSRLYDDMIMSRRDLCVFSSRLYETYVDSRRDYMRLMLVLASSRRDLCGFVYFFMGALDIIAFLC